VTVWRRLLTPLGRSLCLSGFCLLAVVAHADGSVSGTVVVGSDYVFRGVSQTYGGAALQGALNYRHPSGWFAGVWASNVDPYPFTSNLAEANVYGGIGWSLSPRWTANASYTRYLYPLDHRKKPYDYGEVALSLAFEDRLTATVSYQPDSVRYSTLGYVHDRPSMAYELAGRWPLARGVSVVAGAGYYDLTHLYGAGYWSGSAGLSYTIGPYQVDVVRFFADPTVYRLFDDASADGRWVAAVIRRF
jgi:uncharacterized protein (TIGR02001 family)